MFKPICLVFGIYVHACIVIVLHKQSSTVVAQLLLNVLLLVLALCLTCVKPSRVTIVRARIGRSLLSRASENRKLALCDVLVETDHNNILLVEGERNTATLQ